MSSVKRLDSHKPPSARAGRRILSAALLLSALSAAGCGPKLIRDYNVRGRDLFFVYSQDARYAVGDCQRAPTGELTHCTTYPVEFD